jgi:hypothetical protein
MKLYVLSSQVAENFPNHSSPPEVMSDHDVLSIIIPQFG